LKFGSGLLADRSRQRSTENFFNDADGRRLHAIALRDGAAIASKKLWSLIQKSLCGMNETKARKSRRKSLIII